MVWLRQCKAMESRKIMGKALCGDKTNGGPANISHLLDSERVNVVRAQNLIRLDTLLATHEVCKMLRPSASCECLMDSLENVGIEFHFET